MNPKKMFVVMVTVVLATSIGQIVPAFPQIEEMAQAPAVNPDIGFGWSVAGDCDLDGDGTPDLIVGGPWADPMGNASGRVWVFSGTDGHVICILDGEAAGDRFGFSVSCGGDLNNDGTPDFIVGAPGHSSNTGKVYVYSGQTFSLLHTFSGEATGDKFGFSVSGAGDATADGCKDLIIGAPGADWSDRVNCGKIYLYSGCTWIKYWDDHGEASNDSLGYSVSGGCNVNNDEYDDVIVGAPYVDELLKVDCGRIYVLSGNNPTPALRWKTGENSYDHLGWSVSCVGDFDADSHLDIAAGAPGYNNYAGVVYIYKGTGLCPELCELFGATPGDSFGWSVSGAGDVNNDGRADVIIGAPGADNSKGKAFVYLGPNCSAHCISLGRETGERFGFSVSSAGDVAQGDNNDDVIVGAPLRDCNPYCIGRAYVQSGESGCPEIFDFYPVYPCMKITSPPGDKCLQGGTQYVVKWDTCDVDFFPYVKMRYSSDGGAHWSNLTSSTENDGNYNWQVPSVCSDNSLIEICISNICMNVCDTSGIFTIGDITITSPGSATRWCVGEVDTIRWTSCNISGNVWIHYSTNGGTNWTPITNSTPNNGKYGWTIPNPPSQNCLVKVCGICETDTLCGISNTFSISPEEQCPVLTNYGIIVLLILLMATAVWMIKRKRLATQKSN